VVQYIHHRIRDDVLIHNLNNLSSVTHCNTLQRTATHCNTLQYAAPHCNRYQRSGRGAVIFNRIRGAHTQPQQFVIRNTLPHAATRCTTLQHTATGINGLEVGQSYVTHCNTLHHTATRCTTLHHTAPHCNTLQQASTVWKWGSHT